MPLKTGLVSWWDMEETSTPRLDSHGSNDIVKLGLDASDATAEAGIYGNAIRFLEGADLTYGIASPPPEFNPLAGDFSICGWVYPFNRGGWQPICNLFNSFEPGATSCYFFLVNETGYVQLTVWGDATSGVAIGDTLGLISITAFTMVTAVKSGTTITVYANDTGQSVDSLITTLNDGASTPLEVGGYNAKDPGSSGWNRFHGRIDSLGFWSRALSQADVTELYNGGAGMNYAMLPDAGGIILTARGFANMDRNFINMRG